MMLTGEMNMLGGQMGLEVPRTKLAGTAWFVQISDTHLSMFDHLPERQKMYGDKLGDIRCAHARWTCCIFALHSTSLFSPQAGHWLCRLFARTVLAASHPGALLITGDLVDGKTLLGRGQQSEEEWQVTKHPSISLVAELPKHPPRTITENHPQSPPVMKRECQGLHLDGLHGNQAVSVCLESGKHRLGTFTICKIYTAFYILAFAQTYRRALDTIVQESGIPEATILDLRGNHDAFNMGQR